MRLNKLCLAAIAVAALAVAGRASAKTYEIDYVGDAGFENSYHIVKANGDVAHITGAGTFTATWHVNADKPQNLPNSFSTVCVDLDHLFNKTQTVTPLPIGPGVPGADLGLQRAAWLYNNHIGEVLAAPKGSAERDVKGASLQLAVWAAISGANTVGGNPTNSFKITSSNHQDTLSLADQWLSAAGNSVDSATYLRADHLKGEGQDMMGPPPSAVPEPSSLLLLVSGGLAGLGTLRFRLPRKRRQA